MKKTIQKILSIALILTMVLTMIVPASAAGFFTTQEIFGYEGRIFLTVREDVPVRAEPHNEGTVLADLPKGYPVESAGLFRTRKGSEWIKISNMGYDSVEAWIYLGNLSEHTHHYVNLESYGYGQFEFCDGCGNIRPTSVHSFEVDLDNAQIALAAYSLLPVVGNGFDILDGLVSLYRGNYGDALLSFASALPVLGSAGNLLRAGETFDVVTETTSLTVTLDRIDGYAGKVLVKPDADYYKLKKHMNAMYEATGDLRFYKLAGENIPKRSVAAHHIVAIGDKAADEAAQILMYLGIDLNGASNGVYLCMRSNVCDGAIHVTKHSPEYYATVNKMVTEAFQRSTSYSEQRIEVLKELDKIARALMNGDLSL
ncbi:MAG: AHH domain-containing protein [Oscillospiraceae bacterium]|nr:AHH domain-containing protein [Oscillospiraceae bacterium]